MDFIKKATDSVSGSGSGSTQKTSGDAPKQDYGDKAFGFASKKAGYNVNAEQSEKITDGARGLYEKATGNKVDPKYSN